MTDDDFEILGLATDPRQTRRCFELIHEEGLFKNGEQEIYARAKGMRA